MENFFQHIRDKYNNYTCSLLKQYSREVEKLAKTMERSTFLQQCRQRRVTPAHMTNATQQLSSLFRTTTIRTELKKIETNLHSKLLNIEIKETHINTSQIKKEIKRIEREIINTLNETELTKFKKEQWEKFYNIRNKIKRTHSSKMDRLRLDKFKKFNLEFNEDWVVNYTDIDFGFESRWLLSLGNKFALPVNDENFKPIPLIADIEQWVQNIKDDSEKDIKRAKIANRIASFKRNLRNTDKEKFILAIYKETKNVIRIHEAKIIITTADKGNKTVIMYKENYKRKMEELLKDKTTYKQIQQDPTTKLQKVNNNFITKLYKDEHITKYDKFNMTTHAAAAPELYGLPKIHKENIPMRPIASSVRVPCSKLAKYMGQILKNLISPIYNIKNSYELKYKLEEIDLDDNDIIVSFDVVSLFTNIPIHLAIKNILGKWDIISNSTTIPKKQFLKLLQFCLTENNYFTYDNKFYHQTYGMPMGNPLSPTIADIVLDSLLDDVIKELNENNIQIKFLTKYVDDLFAVIDKSNEHIILKTLNTYHNKIKFTIEKENNGELPYLDMKIIRNESKLKTNWYTKATSSGRMINFNSTQPMKTKINTATNFIEKILKISDKEFHKANLVKIRRTLTMNNYPADLINKLVNKILSNSTTKHAKIKEEKLFYSVPYIPKLTEAKTMKHMINDEKATVAHKSNQTLRQLFKRDKTRQDILTIDNVVYEIECDGNDRERCNKVYVGTTKRMLGTRIAEHKADINKERETTGLAQHVKESKHMVKFDKIKILDKESKVNKRYTLESLRIQQRLEHAMNTREDKDNTKLQYSVAII